MKYMFIILFLLSCEQNTDVNNSDNKIPEGDISSRDYTRMELSEAYNFNGYDYTVEKVDLMLPENYTDDVYKKYTTVYYLKRDDGGETIQLKNKSYPKNIAIESMVWWSYGTSGKSRKSELTVHEDYLTICYNEEDDSDPFEIVYVRVCDEFRSTK